MNSVAIYVFVWTFKGMEVNGSQRGTESNGSFIAVSLLWVSDTAWQINRTPFPLNKCSIANIDGFKGDNHVHDRNICKPFIVKSDVIFKRDKFVVLDSS